MPSTWIIEHLANRLDKNDTDCRIAGEILNLISSVPYLTLQELAQQCFVSPSTLTRFLKSAGWSSYSLFQKDVRETRYDFIYRSVYVPRSVQNELGASAEVVFLDAIIRICERLREELPQMKLQEICKSMHEADCVSFLGPVALESVNMSILRRTLALTGKKTRLFEYCSYEQLDHFHPGSAEFCCFIKAESPGSHVLDDWILRAKDKGAKVLGISNVRDFSMSQYCDYALHVDGLQAFADSYGMEALLSLIAITYRNQYSDELR